MPPESTETPQIDAQPTPQAETPTPAPEAAPEAKQEESHAQVQDPKEEEEVTDKATVNRMKAAQRAEAQAKTELAAAKGEVAALRAQLAEASRAALLAQEPALAPFVPDTLTNVDEIKNAAAKGREALALARAEYARTLPQTPTSGAAPTTAQKEDAPDLRSPQQNIADGLRSGVKNAAEQINK